MSDDGRAPLLWYAMSSPYGREKKAEEALAKKAIECFVPRRRVETITGNRREVKFVTEVRNLIFVHTTEDTMRAIKPHTALPFPFRRTDLSFSRRDS